MAARRPPNSLAALLADIQARPSVYFPALGKGPAGRTAQAATYLNYGPQFDALSALLGTARENRRTTIQSARRSGLAGSQGIQKIRDSYTTGLKDTLGSLGGPVAADASTATPEQRAAQQLGLSGTALAGMLSSMAAQQVAGIGNQSAQARRQFSSERSQIGDKIGALFGQAGAYNTQQFETLAGQQRKQRAEALEAQARLRKDLMVAGINPNTGRYDPSLDAPANPSVNKYGRTNAEWRALSDAERKAIIKSYGAAGREPDGSKDRGARVERYREIRDTIQRTRTTVKTLAAQKIHYNPDTGAAVKPDEDGNYPDGTKTRRATEAEIAAAMEQKYPKAPPVVIQAAVEMGIDGRMSVRTLRALRRRYPKIEMPRRWVDRPNDGWKPKPAGNPFDPFDY